MSFTVRFRMSDDAADLVPAKAHASDAAWDLHARADAVIEPGAVKLVPTGLFLELPEGFEAQVRPRSGLAIKKAVTVWNSPGTIDSGYRGEVQVILYNGGKEDFQISRGDRIAQMVITQLPEVSLLPADMLNDTDRGAGGFGSTGV